MSGINQFLDYLTKGPKWVSSNDPMPVIDGVGAGVSEEVAVLSNASATGDPTDPMAGGTYLWQYQGTFSGATLTLESLGPDGSTYQTVAAVTSAGQQAILVGQGDVLRVSISGGPPSGIYSALRRAS